MKQFGISLKHYVLPILILFSALDEMVREKEIVDKVDDIVYLGIFLFALGVQSFVKGKVQRWIFFIAFAAATFTKIIALFIEHDDFKAIDHDYGILGFMLIFVLVSFLVKRGYKK